MDDQTPKSASALAWEQAREEEAARAKGHPVSWRGTRPFMTDARGAEMPLHLIHDKDLLRDQMVRKIIEFAVPLSEQVSRFRAHSFDDVDAFQALLLEKYGAKQRGTKGYLTYTSYDGLLKVQVSIGENITFGPELQVAKALVDECLRDWTDGARIELIALVDRAFQVDKEGKINRGALLGLRQFKIEDERWQRAMQALSDSIQVIGRKRYVRCYRRANTDAPWEAIVIDVAAS